MENIRADLCEKNVKLYWLRLEKTGSEFLKIPGKLAAVMSFVFSFHNRVS